MRCRGGGRRWVVSAQGGGRRGQASTCCPLKPSAAHSGAGVKLHRGRMGETAKGGTLPSSKMRSVVQMSREAARWMSGCIPCPWLSSMRMRLCFNFLASGQSAGVPRARFDVDITITGSAQHHGQLDCNKCLTVWYGNGMPSQLLLPSGGLCIIPAITSDPPLHQAYDAMRLSQSWPHRHRS